jgi:hypothetical protein
LITWSDAENQIQGEMVNLQKVNLAKSQPPKVNLPKSQLAKKSTCQKVNLAKSQTKQKMAKTSAQTENGPKALIDIFGDLIFSTSRHLAWLTFWRLTISSSSI